MKPKIPITDKAFKWVASAKTDVRKTWARARREMEAQKEAELEAQREAEKTIVQIRRKA